MRELLSLERWRDEVAVEAPAPIADPPDPLIELRDQLQRAISEERFEDAARLRDEVRRLSESPFRARPDEKL